MPTIQDLVDDLVVNSPAAGWDADSVIRAVEKQNVANIVAADLAWHGLVMALANTLATALGMLKKQDNAADRCNHDDVEWGTLESEYQSDGTVEVWQQGVCRHCGKEVLITYAPEDVVEQS
jgi:hypothetical protein